MADVAVILTISLMAAALSSVLTVVLERRRALKKAHARVLAEIRSQTSNQAPKFPKPRTRPL